VRFLITDLACLKGCADPTSKLTVMVLRANQHASTTVLGLTLVDYPICIMRHTKLVNLTTIYIIRLSNRSHRWLAISTPPTFIINVPPRPLVYISQSLSTKPNRQIVERRPYFGRGCGGGWVAVAREKRKFVKTNDSPCEDYSCPKSHTQCCFFPCCILACIACYSCFLSPSSNRPLPFALTPVVYHQYLRYFCMFSLNFHQCTLSNRISSFPELHYNLSLAVLSTITFFSPLLLGCCMSIFNPFSLYLQYRLLMTLYVFSLVFLVRAAQSCWVGYLFGHFLFSYHIRPRYACSI